MCSAVLSGTILITLLVVVRLQVLGDPCAMPVGERRISAMFYDVSRDQLLTASTIIDVLPLTRAVHDIAQLPRTHDRPLAVVSWCPVFCASLLTSASAVRYHVHSPCFQTLNVNANIFHHLQNFVTHSYNCELCRMIVWLYLLIISALLFCILTVCVYLYDFATTNYWNIAFVPQDFNELVHQSGQ